MTKTINVTVGSGEVKRAGRWHAPGSTLEITQAEFDAAPRGVYVLPGAPDPEVAQAEARRREQDEADKAEKMRRMEQDRMRREALAEANLKRIREQEQLAQAGVARQKRKPLTSQAS